VKGDEFKKAHEPQPLISKLLKWFTLLILCCSVIGVRT